MTDIRDRIVELARSYAGVSVSSDRYRYLDLVGPKGIEGAAREAFFASPRTSGCGLTIRGLWRKMGLDHPRLMKPYVMGMGIADLVAIAREFDAWIPNFKMGDRRPLPGDAILVGGSGQEHVATITEVFADDYFESCDGGQVDQLGNQCIALRHRRWRKVGTNVLDTAEGLYGPKTKPVQGFVSIDRLPFFPYEPDDPNGCSLPG